MPLVLSLEGLRLMSRMQQIIAPGKSEKEKQQRHDVETLFFIQINIVRLRVLSCLSSQELILSGTSV